MGLGDRMKAFGKKTVDVTKKVGRKTVDVTKRAGRRTKEILSKRTCADCKHYKKIDDDKGDCPIAGERLGSAGANTCPQNAFERAPHVKPTPEEEAAEAEEAAEEEEGGEEEEDKEE